MHPQWFCLGSPQAKFPPNPKMPLPWSFQLMAVLCFLRVRDVFHCMDSSYESTFHHLLQFLGGIFLVPLHKVWNSPLKTEPFTASKLESAFSEPNENWPSTCPCYHGGWPKQLVLTYCIPEQLWAPSCITGSAVFWHISRAVTSTGFPRQGSSLTDSSTHFNCLDQHFTWYLNGAASPYTANIHSQITFHPLPSFVRNLMRTSTLTSQNPCLHTRWFTLWQHCKFQMD